MPVPGLVGAGLALTPLAEGSFPVGETRATDQITFGLRGAVRFSLPISMNLENPRRVMLWGGGGLALLLVVWLLTRGGADKDLPTNANVLQVMKAEQARDVPALTAALSHSDPDAARAAIRGLGNVMGPRAAPQVQTALADPRPRVRVQAALELASFGASARASLPALRGPAGNDQSVDVRVAAVQALGAMESMDAVEPLMSALNDPEARVRRAALGSLEGLLRVRYAYYNADDSAAQRQQYVARIRSALPINIRAWQLWQEQLGKQARQQSAAKAGA